MVELNEEETWFHVSLTKSRRDPQMDARCDEIIRDFNADLPAGYEVGLDREEPETGGQWWTLGFGGVRAWNDGPGRGGDHLDVEALIDMLNDVQYELIEHDFHESWPKCPSHPLRTLDVGVDGWHCPVRDPSTGNVEVWLYGSLSSHSSPPGSALPE